MMWQKNILNGKKRNGLDIERDFLEYLIFNPGGVKATNVLFKVNMSYLQLRPYLNKWLTQQLLIRKTTMRGKSMILSITKLGIDRYIQLRMLEYPGGKI